MLSHQPTTPDPVGPPPPPKPPQTPGRLLAFGRKTFYGSLRMIGYPPEEPKPDPRPEIPRSLAGVA